MQTHQNGVQGGLEDLAIVRSSILTRKQDLLAWLNEVNAILDGYYAETDFYAARPLVPSVSDGQEAFTRPMVDIAVVIGTRRWR